MKPNARLGWLLALALSAGAAAPVLAQPAKDKPKEEPKAPAKEPAKEPAKTEPTKSEPAKTDKPADPKTTEPAKEKFVYVSLKTSMGEIFLELNAEKAPISVENFLKYLDSGFYDGTIFHRVMDNFMIQGGGFTPDSLSSPKKGNPSIKNEWKNGLKNVRGSVAMARTSVADSATSQFFINVKDNLFLDEPRDGAGYAVFAKVVGGMDVVDKIKGVKTGVKGGMGDVPEKTVLIEKVTRTTAEVATAKK